MTYAEHSGIRFDHGPGALPASLPGGVPAFAALLRPALVLTPRDSHVLIAAAAHSAQDTAFSVGRGGIQVWSHSLDGAVHLGSVDWAYDTPVRHCLTVYRASVTDAGVDAGRTPAGLLGSVLALAGLPLDSGRVDTAVAVSARASAQRSGAGRGLARRDPLRRLADRLLG